VLGLGGEPEVEFFEALHLALVAGLRGREEEEEGGGN